MPERDLASRDVIVIGAGVVGAAIACGLAWRGLRVLALDGGDLDFRAARANFGLVSVQGKGLGAPAYQLLTRASADAWAGFAARLADCSGIDVQHERRGGLTFCVGDEAFEARRQRLVRLHNQVGGAEPDFEMMDRAALERFLPRLRLGDAVVGASFGRYDGQVNPLRLLAALHRAIARGGGDVLYGHPVSALHPSGAGFAVEAGGRRFAAARVVIAAGLASSGLARQVGLNLPLRSERGQLLVTERMAPLLPVPASGLRQTAEGTVMIGLTNEDVGPDVSVTAAAAAAMSRRALRLLPGLAGARVVRHWAGLRVLPPDGLPVYAQSADHPGAFVAACHSGVTLAAAHAGTIAAAVAGGALPADLAPFHNGRFDVPQAA